MTTLELLLMAWAAGLVLERRDGKLIVKGLTPDTPPELVDLLREHKPALLAILSERVTP